MSKQRSVVQAVVPPELRDQLDAAAKANGMTTSQLAKVFLTKGLAAPTVAFGQQAERRADEERRASLEEQLVEGGYVSNPDDAGFVLALARMYLGDGVQDEIAAAGGLEAFESRLMTRIADRLMAFHLSKQKAGH